MDELVMSILNEVSIKCDSMADLDGKLIQREVFLTSANYEHVQSRIPELKNFLSSSSLTSLQNPAGLVQRWPLLNLVRQLLKTYHYSMEPVRKSDGYTAEGKKRYKRYFLIKKEIK